jgi:uncharacterized protein (DUF2147 family)
MKLSSLMLLLCLSGMGTVRGQATLEGDWQTTIGAIVHVYPCGDAMCFKIARFATTRVDPKDFKNKDAALRQRDLCGLTIGSGFRADGPKHFSGGELYDPDSGRTYKGAITLNDAKLELRGYVGIPMFGETQTWSRVPERAYAACR